MLESRRFNAWRSVVDACSRLRGGILVFLLMSLTLWGLVTAARLALRFLLAAARTGPDTAPSGHLLEFGRGWQVSVDVLGVPHIPPVRVFTDAPFVEALLVVAISAPFAGAFAAFALRRAAGLPVEYRMLFRHTRHFPTFLTTGLLAVALMWLAAEVAAPLVVVAIVAIALASGFLDLYVVDRDLGPVQAIGRSVGLAVRNLPQYLLLLLALWAASTLTGVTFGLAGIWLTPLLQIACACAFRDAEGIDTAGEPLPLEVTRGQVTAA